MFYISQETQCLDNTHGRDPLIKVVILSGSCNSTQRCVVSRFSLLHINFFYAYHPYHNPEGEFKCSACVGSKALAGPFI